MAIRSLRKECAEELASIASSDERLIALEGDLCESTQSIVFKQKVPARHFEMGIAEQNMVGVAAGLAACGKIPIVHSFACFISMRACEQVRTSVAYPALNVKFVVSHAGISAGTAGTTHHAIEDIAIMRAIPNMTVIVPGDGQETRQALKAAMKLHGPVYFRLSASDVEDFYRKNDKFKIGKATLLRHGNDASIITTGIMGLEGTKASDILFSKYGIKTRVLHMACIKPIDREAILKACAQTKNIVTVEEHNVIGGLGGAVCEIAAEQGSVRVKRLGINDVFSGTASPSILFKRHGLTSENIVTTVLKLIKK